MTPTEAIELLRVRTIDGRETVHVWAGSGFKIELENAKKLIRDADMLSLADTGSFAANIRHSLIVHKGTKLACFATL